MNCRIHMHFIRGATAWEGQIWRVCWRLPYLRFIAAGNRPCVYLAQESE